MKRDPLPLDVEATHICPRCRTMYFEALEECDWCADSKPMPIVKKPDARQD